MVETTALGAAHLAGLATGFWKDFEEFTTQQHKTVYMPKISHAEADRLYFKWQKAVQAARAFSE